MALGTVTLVRGSIRDSANVRQRTYDIQCTSGANYVTGGGLITAAAVGMARQIESIVAEGNAQTVSGTTSRTVHFTHNTNGSVNMIVDTTFGTEASTNADLSTFFVRVVVTGR